MALGDNVLLQWYVFNVLLLWCISGVYVYNFRAHFIIPWCAYVARDIMVVWSVCHLLVCCFSLSVCVGAQSSSARLKFILGEDTGIMSN